MRRLVPRLLQQRARCPVATPNWLDALAAEQLPLTDLTNALNHLYGAYNTGGYGDCGRAVRVEPTPEVA